MKWPEQAIAPKAYVYPSDFCGEPTHIALAGHSVQSLDALLLAEAPLLRDGYLAYALRHVQGEVASILSKSVDDEIFVRVMGALGADAR